MVMVRISETYDLSTKINKMGLIGVHTPGLDTINSLYPGFMRNYRKYRLVSCDVTLACASVLPADPLQIGTEEGDIAPQDMFNPILYTAVSNDSFNTILNRIYALGSVIPNAGPQSIVTAEDAFPSTESSQFDVYYGLLSGEGWKKAMPQAGLDMRGLFPIVYEVVNNYGNMTSLGAGSTAVLQRFNATSATGDTVSSTSSASSFRGESKRMPALPTHRATDSGLPSDWAIEFPTTFVAAIITPPAKLHKLFYRMRVSWDIEWFDPVPDTEFAPLTRIALAGQRTYASDYAQQSKEMDSTTDMVDVKDAEIAKVMTSGK